MTGPSIRALLVCALLLPPGAVLGQAATLPSSDAPGVTVASGPVSGVYYQVGNAICRLLERARRAGDPDGAVLPCGSMMTGGSVHNVAVLRTGAADAALIQSDILDLAVRGSGPFEGRTGGKLRALFSLHREPYQLLVDGGLRLRSFADLKGHKVNVGRLGSASHETFAALMQRHDLADASFASTVQLGGEEQFSAFCDGGVEALGMMIGAPNAAYQNAISRCGGDLLGLDTAADRTLVSDTAAYTTVVIPRGTYDGIDRDVSTFGVVAVVAATAEMPDDVAYRIVRSVFENLDALRTMHPALASLDPRRMATDGMTSPLHPGALRYFREQDLVRPPD